LMAFEQDGSSITIRTLVEPLVGWIWVGSLIMGIGAAIALRFRSRRADDSRVRSPRPAEGGARRPREEVAA
ncbi:MAG: hypothetical protein P8177_12355, partial [Gemmatimonadota bacterium]